MCPACLAAAAPAIAGAASGSAALAFVSRKLLASRRADSMLRMSYPAIVVAAVAAFISSSVALIAVIVGVWRK